MNDYGAVKLVVWDFDGTLIDSYAVYAEILREAAALRGVEAPTDEVMHHNFHGSLDESIKAAFDMVEGEAFSTILNDFLRLQENYYNEPEQHIYADALALMKRFDDAGIKQIVATNREHKGRGTASPRHIIEHSSLKAYVDDVVCGEEGAAKKPDAQVLAYVPATQELTGAHMLVIGDQFVDAQLASNLGAQAIIVNRNDQPVPHLEPLVEQWQSSVRIVASLDDIIV